MNGVEGALQSYCALLEVEPWSSNTRRNLRVKMSAVCNNAQGNFQIWINQVGSVSARQMIFLSTEPVSTKAARGGRPLCVVMTALDVETRAVLAHLGAVTTRKGRTHLYECGDCDPSASWLVAVVEIDQGNISAANALHGVLADFKEVDLVLFIGVAGALKKDVGHGAVVVGSKVYNGHSVKSDVNTFGRPNYFKPDAGIIQVAKKVARDQDWVARVRAPSGGTLPPQSAYPCAWPPSASVGPVASVEGVVSSKESALFVQISEHLNDAQAVEMEGHGLMAAADHQKVSALVVRGISDGIHDKTWFDDSIRQPVAAAHAAAFAMELLSLLTPPAEPDLSSESLQGDKSAPVIPPASDSIGNRASVVLVLNGEMATFDTAKQEALVQAIRDATGDLSVIVKSISKGSVRVHLEVAESARKRKTFEPQLRAAAGRIGEEVIAVGSEESLHQVLIIREEFKRASLELAQWERTLPGGVWLDRPELGTVLNRMASLDSTTTLIVGKPGSGKSALAATLTTQLQGAGKVVLAIKADQLPPEAATPIDLKNALQLSFDVVSSAYQIAQWSPVTIIIDQLDAVARYVDLKTQRLNLLINLIKQLSGVSRIHLVVTCREFEQQHDVRIRSIDAEVIRLAPPALRDVFRVLEAFGIDASGWPVEAQQLLQSPQQLKVFVELFGGGGEAAVSLTYQSMLDRMWQERILERPSGREINRLALRIAAAMAEQEALWLPSAMFDDEVPRLQELEAAGFLTFSSSRSRLAFTHQTVYEHALARTFAKQEESLSRFVLNRQESLFVRPKLWFALGYLREVDRHSYIRETRALWGAGQLRFHLRALLVEFVGQVSQPTPDELDLALSAAKEPALKRVLLEAMRANADWFGMLKHSVIESAMVEADNTGRALEVLKSNWHTHKADVLGLVSTTWLSSAKWDTAIWRFLDGIDNWDDTILAIAKKVIARTEIADSSVSRVAMAVGVHDPSLAIELVHAQLDAELKRAAAKSDAIDPPPFPVDGSLVDQVQWSTAYDRKRPFENIFGPQSDWYDLPALAKAAPREFLTTLWPWFERLFEYVSEPAAHHRLCRYREQSGLSTILTFERGEGRVEHPVLDALVAAIEALAADDAGTLKRWMAKVRKSDLMVVHRFVAYGYACAAQQLASQALTYLLGDRRRLMLGTYSSRFSSTVALIEAISSRLNKSQLAKLEAELRRFDPYRSREGMDAKERWNARRMTRSDRLRLLQALPFDALSADARKLVSSELRVLGQPQEDARMSVGYIGSPMSAQEMRAASDDQVVKFLLELPDSTGWDHPKRWMQGGSVQASREFSSFAKAQPERAVAIIDRLPVATHQRSIAYALEALAESDYPVDKLQRLLTELLCLDGWEEEFKTSVARAVSTLVKRSVSIKSEIVEVLHGWIEHSVEGGSEIEEEESDDTDDDRRESILWGHGGFSILPGGVFPILEALRDVHLHRTPAEVHLWLEVLERYLHGNDDVRIWKALLPRLQSLYKGNAEDADTFLSNLFKEHPSLLGTREAALLLAHIRGAVKPAVFQLWLNAMYTLPGSRIRQAWGELWALTKLTQTSSAASDQQLPSELPLSARVGVVYAAAHLWNFGPARDRATELIVGALLSGDRSLIGAAMTAVRITDPLVPDGGTIAVLEAVRDMPIAGHIPQADYLIQRTSALLPHQSALVADVARKVAETCGPDLANFATSIGGLAPDLADLAITLHRIPSTRAQGLELFEFLVQIGAYGSKEMMDKIDGKLRNSREIPRRRLRRQRK